jgi:hypothetical protein
MKPEQFRDRMREALTTADMVSARSLQTAPGFSDLACREKIRRKLLGVPPSSEPDRWAAIVGKAVHRVVAEAAPYGFPNVKVEPELSCRLPSGIVVVGHPDQIDPDEPSCSDANSVSGPGEVLLKEKNGPAERELMQVSLGYLAAYQAGIIASLDGIVRLFWLDRSGKSSYIAVWQEAFDPAWVDKANVFFSDARYHADHDEEAMKDPHWSWCRQFCDQFDDCRGGDQPQGEWITDPELVQVVLDHYVASREASDSGARKEASREVLIDRLSPRAQGGDARTYKVPGELLPAGAFPTGLRTRITYLGPTEDRAESHRVETGEITEGDR